ncbi:unnamed protein product [Rhizophagus irregularis]|nr:unnamed protein product [Rhizophagus irregularis]
MSDSDSFSSDDEFLPMILLEIYQMTDDNFNFNAKQIACKSCDESFITGSNHNIDTHEDQHQVIIDEQEVDQENVIPIGNL